jgi:hypothetical protein
VIDVLNIYNDDVVPKHARPVETGQRLLKLAEFWESCTLADVTGQRCRAYVTWRTKQRCKGGSSARLVSEAAPGASWRICALRSFHDRMHSLAYGMPRVASGPGAAIIGRSEEDSDARPCGFSGRRLCALEGFL